jgi:hypothetical protein
LTCTPTQAVAYLLDFNRLLSPPVGLPRATAAFHLDRLVEEDLLDVSYQRRSGPGAGRPAKLYRRSPHQVAVSLPQRRYDLAGQLLSSAWSTPSARGTHRGRFSTSAPINWAKNSAKRRTMLLVVMTPGTPLCGYLRSTAFKHASKE